METEPEPYEPPVLIVLGTVAEQTQALQMGVNIDLDEFTQSL